MKSKVMEVVGIKSYAPILVALFISGSLVAADPAGIEVNNRTSVGKTATADEPILHPGVKLAVVGDSITQQKIYSRYIETYLRMCSGIPNIEVFQFGWNGEHTGGFASRIDRDLACFKPDVLTICYGMNDACYRPFEEKIGKTYEEAMGKVLDSLKEKKIKAVLGTPGAVDTFYFKNGIGFGDRPMADGYNESLGKIRDIGKRLAENYQLPFADIHSQIIATMEAAKKANGKEYDVCGKDGFHPSPNGHLVMAYVFLKALGCDGNIGEIVIDMKNGTTCTEGHKAEKSVDGMAEIVSQRFPFCFDADTEKSDSNRSILPFLPFNRDLNRFILKVKNLDTSKAKVKWGDEVKEFTKGQLQSGINLMEEFQKTPFDDQFRKISELILKKQNFETVMIQSGISNLDALVKIKEFQNDEGLKVCSDKIVGRLKAHRAALDDKVRAEIKPVSHKITVVPSR